nr:probable E3 ubiquitin-protein ligase bre1 [Pocillopora verrucosa]
MDWAMKFLQLKYREKRSDLFGKRGSSWHISTVITRNPNLEGRLELRSYAHLFDTCQQDWFAVCSIIESTLIEIKTEKPHITWVYLRSDKAGYYHNNSLIAAARGTASRRQQARSEVEHNPKELFLEEEEAERKQLLAHISNELRLQHPLPYDAFNLCDNLGSLHVISGDILDRRDGRILIFLNFFQVYEAYKMAAPSSKASNSIMFWTYDHEAILCREVVNVNPYTTKKGSTQRSSMWEKIADTLNKCSVPKFRVDKRSVRDHVGILVYKHKKKLQAEEKATGITPDESTELENLLDTIIALEESGEAELQETQGTSSKKLQYDRAKAEDVRLKAMEKLSDTKKRDSSADESDDKPKRQRRSGGDAIEYLTERAKVSDQLKAEDLKMRKEHQTLEREKMEVLREQQMQMQQQQADMLKVMQQQQQQSQQQLLNSQMMMMQQQQQQSKALMALLEKITNK